MSTRNLTLADITFAITAFDRPHLLTKLVHSIRRNYPSAKIIVADNGRRKATLPDSVQVFHLPFDCGLSMARNFLASKVTTATMLLLEEDFLFLPTTRIEPLLEVLKGDQEVGVVGGAMLGGNGEVSAFSMDIDLFRRTMFLHESRHRHRITASGQPYRLCDVILNFSLFRREMLLDHPWDESLKVGEHTPYFNEVKKSRRWRVACCCESIVYHVPDQRTKEYAAYRQRAGRYFAEYLRRNGLDQCVRVDPQCFENSVPARPDIVVLGVGHSGTSVLAKMLHAAGWEPGDADDAFGESVSIRQMNQYAMQHGQLPKGAMRTLRRIPKPWAIKDPRFVETLRYWLPLMAKLNQPPTLVMIRRSHDEVVASYRRRHVRGDIDAMVSARSRRCDAEFARWPWSKLLIDYEDLSHAVALFREFARGGLTTEEHIRGSQGAPIEISGNPIDASFLADESGSIDRSAYANLSGGGSPSFEGQQRSTAGSFGDELAISGSVQSFTISKDGSVGVSTNDGSKIDERTERLDDGSL